MHRSIILLSLLTLFAVSGVVSQTLKPPSGGNKALLFNFVGLSTISLDAYQGGIGGKYFLSDALALRAMLQLSVNDQTAKTTPQETNNTLGFGIGGALEYHLPLSSSVSPYLGGGLSVSMATNKQNQYAETKTTDLAIGVGVLAGVEYFFNQNLSLAGEYQFGFSASSTTQTGSADRSTLQLGFQTAGLTLAAYF